MRLGIALAFRYLCHTKAEDGAFGHGRCRNIEDSYPAWKQAGLIYILYVRWTSYTKNWHFFDKQDGWRNAHAVCLYGVGLPILVCRVCQYLRIRNSV